MPVGKYEGVLAKTGRRRGLILGCAATFLVVVVGVVLVFIIVRMMGPDTFVIAGPQVPKHYKDHIHKLGLLAPGEELRFFYSDAFFNIRNGMYLLTNKKLVVYSDSYDPPAVIVPFDEIRDVGVDFGDSQWNDSVVKITLRDGQQVWFPLSTEREGDRDFLEALEASRHSTGVKPAPDRPVGDRCEPSQH